MFIIKKALAESTWAEIKEFAKKRELSRVFGKGDQIPVKLKNDEEVIFTVGRDESGKFYFVMEDCLNETRPMNNVCTNAGGWKATEVRTWLNEDFFALLPDDLQEIIVPTKIVQVLDGERVECEDKIFMLSKTQVFGKGPWSVIEPEDTQLDIFPTEKSRVKECGDNGTWWYGLRTPPQDDSNYFCVVYISGRASSTSAGRNRGVAPGFCIEESETIPPA